MSFVGVDAMNGDLTVNLWRATYWFGNSLGCLGEFLGTSLANSTILLVVLEASFGDKRCLPGTMSHLLFGESIGNSC